MTMVKGRPLISPAIAKVSEDEGRILIQFLDSVLKQESKDYSGLGMLRLIESGQHGAAFKTLVLYANRLAREYSSSSSAATQAPLARTLLNLREKLSAARCRAAMTGARAVAPSQEASLSIEAAIIRAYQLTVHRSPAASEIEIWKNNLDNGLPFHEFLLLMSRSTEARDIGSDSAILGGASDGEFVQTTYERVIGRGAAGWEIDAWVRRLEDGKETRAKLLASRFNAAAAFFSSHGDTVVNDGLSCLIMGTGKHVTADDWKHRALALRDAVPKPPASRHANRFRVSGEPRVLVSALASMYRGGDFIEQFMDNITGQDGFDDYCELVIVDADSPENEYETIKRYLARHKNINYIRCNYRLGIYDAWNVAAKAARGLYLTNTNMDDLRRHDSLMLQAATLENLPFVDVAYQDLYYTFDARLSFEQIAAFDLQTTLPVITPHNMIQFNSPHNAPMWRRSLHDELGYFDTHYRSAGDYDFWLRCLAAGKKFYKTNDPHVVYYQNPKGLSTRPDTRGVIEAMEVHKAYCRKLVPQEAVMPTEDFLRTLDPSGSVALEGASKDRYLLAQRALRGAARRLKYPAQGGGAP